MMMMGKILIMTDFFLFSRATHEFSPGLGYLNTDVSTSHTDNSHSAAATVSTVVMMDVIMVLVAVMQLYIFPLTITHITSSL